MIEIDTAILQLLFTAVGGFIGFCGAYFIFRRQEKVKIQLMHFERIKLEVLEPWLDFLLQEDVMENWEDGQWTEAMNEYESMNKQLLNDVLINHFPKLKILKRSFEKEKRIMKVKIKQLEEIYKGRFPELETVVGKSIMNFFINESDLYKLHLETTNLSFGVKVIAHGEERLLSKLKTELEKDYGGKLGKETRKINHNIIKKSSLIHTEIEKALAIEKLPGKCNLI
ncbi:MAG: hypothetical protein NTU57_00325 [Candidatus Aenigmarchaeota archaeon]|nr:hypothetical protein [Candidatus Aenigmarchaeota archaeon]